MRLTVPNWLAVKNSRNVGLWRWRWHLQGGSKFWIARDLRDLRTDDERRRWRRIQVEVRHTPYFKRGNVVNLTHERFERERRRQAIGRTALPRALLH